MSASKADDEWEADVPLRESEPSVANGAILECDRNFPFENEDWMPPSEQNGPAP